jgi:hypothetical protein
MQRPFAPCLDQTESPRRGGGRLRVVAVEKRCQRPRRFLDAPLADGVDDSNPRFPAALIKGLQQGFVGGRPGNPLQGVARHFSKVFLGQQIAEDGRLLLATETGELLAHEVFEFGCAFLLEGIHQKRRCFFASLDGLSHLANQIGRIAEREPAFSEFALRGLLEGIS